jgi:hypothetical protein
MACFDAVSFQDGSGSVWAIVNDGPDNTSVSANAITARRPSCAMFIFSPPEYQDRRSAKLAASFLVV